MTETRTYWLSFASDEGFLGAVVVDLTTEDVAAAQTDFPAVFPLHVWLGGEEGPWLAAATRACWLAQCHPGGEVAAARIDGLPEAARYPRWHVLSKLDIAHLDGEEPVNVSI